MIIPARFNGPDGSGNGGYTCGLVAQLLGGGAGRASAADLGPPIEVTLRVPPPLGTRLSVVRAAGPDRDDGPGHETIEVYAGTTLVAQAHPTAPLGAPVPPVSLAGAAEASRAYPGFAEHPFPACYVCGPQRPRGDGLRVFPGRLPDGRTAAPFTAPADVSAATIWAALDCPGGWAVISPGRAYVLGRLAAAVSTLPRPGEHCVVVGACEAVDGRKAFVATSLYGPTGALVGTARATWIALPPAADATSRT